MGKNVKKVFKKLKEFLTKMYIKIVYPTGFRPARMYSLPKLHKIFNSVIAFRPILSLVGTYNYQLAKFLVKLLDNFISNDYSTKDTLSFVEELKTYMVSYDVTSLFTNILLEKTIHLTIDLLFETKSDLKISRKYLQKLAVYHKSNQFSI